VSDEFDGNEHIVEFRYGSAFVPVPVPPVHVAPPAATSWPSWMMFPDVVAGLVAIVSTKLVTVNTSPDVSMNGELPMLY